MSNWLCPDGRVYTGENSIFGANESIWTYNCPCPSGTGCLTKHVCRFKHENAGSNLKLDTLISKLLADEFQQLLTIFNRRYETPKTVAEKDDEVENQSQYTNYCKFRELRDSLKLSIKHKMCRHRQGCHSKQECVFAHSVYEMLQPFGMPQVKKFYQHEVNIKEAAYKPTTYLLQGSSNVKCPTLGCKTEQACIQLRLYQTVSTELYYPYLIIRCGNCKRVTNVPVYR